MKEFYVPNAVRAAHGEGGRPESLHIFCTYVVDGEARGGCLYSLTVAAGAVNKNWPQHFSQFINQALDRAYAHQEHLVLTVNAEGCVEDCRLAERHQNELPHLPCLPITRRLD